MKLRNIISLSLLLLSFALGAQAPSDTVRLWEKGNVLYGEEVALMPYIPENPSGTAVIVCPGGSYFWLDDEGEGFEVARWLCSHDIAAFVLLYRTAGFGAYFWHYRLLWRGNRFPDMITDAQRALQYVREHYDFENLGMMGFSAGGHLVMSSACFSGTDFPSLAGFPCTENLRPDFVAPIYPVVTMREPYVHKRSRRALLGDNRQKNTGMIDSLSLESHIPADCPPVFIANCKDDDVVDYHNSELLDKALSEAEVPHVYYQFETGGHGFGVSDVYGSPECRVWRDYFLEWLKINNLL